MTLTLKVYIKSGADWVEITDDVLPTVSWERGLPGPDILDLVANTGLASLFLDNGPSNSSGTPGLYSPDHADALSSFAIGLPVAIALVNV